MPANTVNFGGGLPSETNFDYAEFERRKKLADALQAQAQAPLQTNAMVGNRVAPLSWTQALAKTLQSGLAGYQRDKATQEQRALVTGAENERRTSLAEALRLGRGAPASSETIMDETAAGGDGQMAQINAPGRPGDPNAMLERITQSRDPGLQQTGANALMARMIPPVPQDFNLAPGASRFRGSDNTLIATAADKPKITWQSDGRVKQAYDQNARPIGPPIPLHLPLADQARMEQKAHEFNNLSAAQQADLEMKARAQGRTAMELWFNTGMDTRNPNPVPNAPSAPMVAPRGAPIPVPGAPPPRGSGTPTPGYPTLPAAGKEQVAKDLQADREALAVMERQLPSVVGATHRANFERQMDVYRQNIAAFEKELGGMQPQPVPAPGPQPIVPPQGAPIPVPPPAPIPVPGRPPLPPRGAVTPKEQATREANRPKATAALGTVKADIATMGKEIDRLLNPKSGLSNVTGPVMGRLPSILEGSTNAEADIEGLKSQIGLQVINAMREMSKTGGAVGNMTEKEWPIVQSKLGSLDTKQGTDRFKAQLRDLKSYLGEMQKRMEKVYSDTYPERRAPATGMAPDGAPVPAGGVLRFDAEGNLVQ